MCSFPLVTVLVPALEGHVVEGSLVRLFFPDAGRNQADADLGDGGSSRFGGLALVRVARHIFFLFCRAGFIACLVMSVREKSGPDARQKTEGLRPPGTAVFLSWCAS